MDSLSDALGKHPAATTTASGPPAWAVPYLQTGMDTAMQDFKKGAGSYVGPTPNQTAGWDLLTNYAKGGAQTVANSAQNAYTYLTDPSKMLNPANNPYLQASVEAALRPVTANFQNVVLPGINDNAVSGGLFGGSRQGVAQSLASQDYLKQLSDTSSNMYSNAYTTGLNAMTGALGDASGVQAAGQMPGTLLGQVGQEQQAAAQAQSNAPFTQLGSLASILGQFLGYSGNQSTTNTPGPSAVQNLSSMAAIYMALKSLYSTSDRKLKRDITRVGKLPSGLPVYSFRFWGSARYHIGVMSDEVRKLFPSAVMVDENGFDMVNYGVIG